MDEGFLKQVQQDAEKIRNLSDIQKARLDRDTDWNGYRMRAYEFPDKGQRVAG
jgi:hypothetical protein